MSLTLIRATWIEQQNLLWITDLDDESNPIGPDMKWIKLIDQWDAEYSM
jgi:hypothetical protein